MTFGTRGRADARNKIHGLDRNALQSSVLHHGAGHLDLFLNERHQFGVLIFVLDRTPLSSRIAVSPPRPTISDGF
jgi:hypothetical protein